MTHEQNMPSGTHRVRQLLDSAFDAVISVDLDSRVVIWNDQAERTFGWSASEACGRRLDELIIPEDLIEAHRRGFYRYLMQGHGPVVGKTVDLEAVDRRGVRFPVQLSISPIRIDNEAAGFTSFIRDMRSIREVKPDLEISAPEEPPACCAHVKRTEEQAAPEPVKIDRSMRVAQQMECLSAVSVGFAHDLNNMLTAIHGHARAAEQEADLSERVRDSLSLIQLAVTRARGLTHNMQLLGNPDDVQARAVNIEGCMQATISLLKPAMPESVELGFTSNVPFDTTIFIDVGGLQQAVINLVLNARDSITEGGRIEVTLDLEQDHEGRWVRLRVRDDGSGIPDEIQEEVFKPFFTTKAPGAGVGIGLAMVSNFVESIEGRISLDSTIGEGTCFAIDLPCLDMIGPETVAGESVADLTAFGRILVIEDYELIRTLIEQAVSSAGHEVASFAGSEGVFECPMIRDGTVDVCVVDMNLGRENGIELVAAIESRLGREVQTIFITGNPKAVRREDIRPSQGLLLKPFSMDALLEEIAERLPLSAVRS